MTVARQVFVRFGLLAMCIGLVGAMQFSLGEDAGLAESFFGVTGVAGHILSVLVLIPVWFLLGGTFGLLGRKLFAAVLLLAGPEKRAEKLLELTNTERRFPWVPNIFFLFGLDHSGRPKE